MEMTVRGRTHTVTEGCRTTPHFQQHRASGMPFPIHVTLQAPSFTLALTPLHCFRYSGLQKDKTVIIYDYLWLSATTWGKRRLRSKSLRMGPG